MANNKTNVVNEPTKVHLYIQNKHRVDTLTSLDLYNIGYNQTSQMIISQHCISTLVVHLIVSLQTNLNNFQNTICKFIKYLFLYLL